MVQVTWKYVVGQYVLAGGTRGEVERRGFNVNKLPVYLVNGKWWFESDLEAAPLPCPV